MNSFQAMSTSNSQSVSPSVIKVQPSQPLHPGASQQHPQQSQSQQIAPVVSPLLESIARYNNAGASYLQQQDFAAAGTSLKRALEKANAMTFFQASAGSNTNTHNIEEEGEEGVPKNLYIYQRGEYDEGMHAYSTPLSLSACDLSSPASSMHTVTATILFNLGQWYVRQNNQDQQAMDCFFQALQILHMGGDSSSTTGISSMPLMGSFKNNNGKTASAASASISVLALYHNIGHLQYRQGHYEDAVRTYSKALELGRAHVQAHQCHSPHSQQHLLDLAATLNCLGVLCFHLPQADTDRAMQLYQESLQLRYTVQGGSQQQQQQQQTPEIATTLNNIGRVYYMKGEHNEALQYYERALAMRRHLLGNHHLDVAATIYNAGQTHHQRGRLQQAMTLYREFLTIAKQRLGQYHRDVATMLKCMAQIHHEQKQYEAAADLYQQALRTGRAALGEYHPEVASTLNKLGNLQYERGDMQAALQVYQQGLQVERAVLDPFHPNIVVTLTNIGQIHKLRGEHQAALRLYKEAVSVQRHSLGPSHPNIATTLSSIALIHYQTRSYTKALDVYQEALRIRRDALGDVHLDVASTLNSIGLVLFKMELHDFALQSFRESLRIRRDLLGAEHREVAIILYNIATIHLEVGDEDEAMAFYRETLRVERAALGEQHPDVVMTMQHIGQVHQQRGELTEALEYFQAALDIQQETNSNNNGDTTAMAAMAQTLNHIGNVHLQRGNAAALVETLAQAVRHLQAAGKSEQDLAISGFNFYGLSKLHPECAPVA